ncbi:tyrosine-type recombinase/integrase [Pseudoflavonifractor phocaeensis]|uniref:tyrosine-type recombinase/integrase n=1 Tax=Pseudoflavonifractor phocaeensis TaxID=1870988 RepID=UPI00195DF540|nr:tyrosine-type recombinase/integrase [Pseudoflavonifractor phocaeensis]
MLEDRVDGGIVKGGAFVLRDECGELITHSKAGHFREHMQQQSGDHFYYHALRHTVVSRLAGAGVPLKNVSAFIGHSDTRTTEMFYLGLDELGENKLNSVYTSNVV